MWRRMRKAAAVILEWTVWTIVMIVEPLAWIGLLLGTLVIGIGALLRLAFRPRSRAV